MSRAPEDRLATRAAGGLSALTVSVVLLLLGLNHVVEAISVPSLPSGKFREQIVVPIIKQQPMVSPAVEPQMTLFEHTVENGAFVIKKKNDSKPDFVQSTVKKEETKPDRTKPKAERRSQVDVASEAKPNRKMLMQPKPHRRLSVDVPQNKVAQKAARGSDLQGVGEAAGVSIQGNTAKESADARQSALAAIVNRIEANKSYPRRARQTGIEGEVILSVRINAKGCVSGIEIAKKHRSALLNRAALRSADSLMGMCLANIGAMSVEVPVVFLLQY